MHHDTLALLPEPLDDDELAQEDLRQLADRVGQIIGSRLRAYVCDAKTVRDFNGWLDMADPQWHAQIVSRLSAVMDLAVPFRRARYLSRMQTWLSEPDQELDRRSPADVIRYSFNEKTVDLLHDAAERYLSTYVPWYRSRVPLR